MKRTELRQIIREELQKLSEVDYKQALASFNDILKKDSSVKKIANHYDKSVDDVVKGLQPRIKVLRHADKSIKEISVDFKDKNSGVTVKAKKGYKKEESDSLNETREPTQRDAKDFITQILKLGTKNNLFDKYMSKNKISSYELSTFVEMVAGELKRY